MDIMTDYETEMCDILTSGVENLKGEGVFIYRVALWLVLFVNKRAKYYLHCQ